MRKAISVVLFAMSCASTVSGQTMPTFQTTPPAPPAAVVKPTLGHYVGNVKTLWNSDGRTMTLLEDFSYIDPDGLEWKAPAGLITDGASIPQEAWSIIGGPFEGVYRFAAVIHDEACDKKDRSWEATHEMFYRAMLTSHVDQTKAKLMYAAVYHFGPRWESTRVTKGISAADKNAAVDSIQHTLRSTNSDAQVGVTNSGTITDPHQQDLTVRFIPRPKTLTKADFDSLKTMIEEREKEKPGSVSLEQIRNYRQVSDNR